MGIRFALHHRTVCEYDRLVSLSPQMIRHEAPGGDET
jgi:hypothetical protein